MLTLWYSHNQSDWFQAEADKGPEGTYVQYTRPKAARTYALKLAKQFHCSVQIRTAEGTVETVTQDSMPDTVKSKLSHAVWKACPGLAEGKYAHSMRDHCWNCAPWWEKYPACPHCDKKLDKAGRTKCKGCNTFVLVGD